MYNFKNDIYPKEISYVNHNSIFQFLADENSVKEFTRYFIKMIISKYENGINLVIENDSDKMTLIDINYNFFIECLGAWCEHYSSNKTILTSYKKYKSTKEKDEKDEEVLLKRVADFEINMTIKERVQFDYGYSGWMVSNKFHKRIRFNFVQTFLNNFVNKVTFVRNYRNAMYAIPVAKMLVKNNTNDNYNIQAVVSFHRPFLSDILTEKNWNILKKISRENEKIITTSDAISKKIKSLEIDEKDVKVYDDFDIKNIEKNRNNSNGEWHFFEKSE